MLLYTTLSDADLDAKIIELTTKYENVQMGGGVAKVQREGRLLEYTKSNSGGLIDLLKIALAERDRRNGVPRGAIEVCF